MDMKKYLLTLALILPLMAQDSTQVKEESKEPITEIHKFPNKRNNRTTYVISEWPQDRKNKIIVCATSFIYKFSMITTYSNITI